MYEIFREFGFSGGLLVAIGIAFWRVLVWFKPLGTRVMTSMSELIDSLKKTTEANSEAITGIRDDIGVIAKELRNSGREKTVGS